MNMKFIRQYEIKRDDIIFETVIYCFKILSNYEYLFCLIHQDIKKIDSFLESLKKLF